MGKPLRQSIELPLGDDSIAVDVTFRVLEAVERHYDMRAEFVGKLILENEARIKRTDIARVIVAWLDLVNHDANRSEVYEAVMTANESTLRKYVGAIQGAIFYSLREISADDLKKLSKGEDLAPSTDDDDGEKKSVKETG